MSSVLTRPMARAYTQAPRSRAFHAATRTSQSIKGQRLEPFNLDDMNPEWAGLVASRKRQQTMIDHFTQLGSTQTRDNTFQPHHSLHRPVEPAHLTTSALVTAGAHLGHSKSLTRPAFLPYAYGHRAGITVIDLDHTVPLLRRAANVVRGIAKNNGTILFVGTRPDLRAVVHKAAERVGPTGFHIGEKWLPGTLTNKVALFGPDVTTTQNAVPDVVIFLNPLQNLHAIRECAIAHVPTIGIIDSNADPRIVMYAIPANDESVRTAELIAGLLSTAAKQGVEQRAKGLQGTTRRARHQSFNS